MDLPPEALPLAADARLEKVGDHHRVTYRLPIPFFGFLFAPLVRRRAREVERAADAGGPLPRDIPWWSPPQPTDAATSSAVAAICLLGLVNGYSGTILTQTLTYAARVYDVNDATLGTGLAVVRVGVVGSLALGLLADRHGRRRFVITVLFAKVALAVLLAFAPTFGVYIGGHILLRATGTAAAVGLVVLLAESVPAGNRAFSLSLLALAAGTGAGGVVALLPLAARGRWGLSSVYLLTVLAVPLVLRGGRILAESPRYLTHLREPSRWREVLGRAHRGRVVMLGATAFLTLIFVTPASDFGNRYLDQVRGFPASRITLFLAVTAIPFLPMLLAGGRWADRIGRKKVGVPAIVLGTLTLAATFLIGTPWLWMMGFVGSAVSAPGVAALQVYGPELFPTRIRNTTNTLLTLIGVVGSAAGLLIAGNLSENWDIGRAVAVLAAGPLLAALIVAAFYPETVRKTLEETSGEDAGPAPRP